MHTARLLTVHVRWPPLCVGTVCVLGGCTSSSEQGLNRSPVMTTRWCDLNSSVRGRVSSSRKRFWTLPNLYSEVSQAQNIIVFILLLYANRLEGSLGHFQTLIQKCPTISFPQIFPLFLLFRNKIKYINLLHVLFA